jgi:hypothetical protein
LSSYQDDSIIVHFFQIRNTKKSKNKQKKNNREGESIDRFDFGEAKGSNQPGAMVLGLSDFQDPNANNKMDMMATAIKHRINKSMRASQLNDKHTTHKRDERERGKMQMRVRWAKTAQLFDVIYVQFSRVGTNKKGADEETEISRRHTRKNQKIEETAFTNSADTSSCCRPTKKYKQTRREKHAQQTHSPPQSNDQPRMASSFQLSTCWAASGPTHTRVQRWRSCQGNMKTISSDRLFLFPLVPFSSKAKRAKHSHLALSLSLSREMMRDFFGFEAGQE